MTLENSFPHATQFDEVEPGKAPKVLDAVDVIQALGKFVFVMVDAVVFITAQNEGGL